MDDRTQAGERIARRRWPFVVAAIVLAPIAVLFAAQGAEGWCSAKLMSAGDGGYENKQMSVSVLPPGVLCRGDIGSRRSESMWPIDW